jgi:hypothetical protein
MEEHHAGHRLITQNLLTAAACSETDTPMTWSMLEQLSILIDLVCLYDQVWIMGRQAYDMLSALQSGPRCSGQIPRELVQLHNGPAHKEAFCAAGKVSDEFGPFGMIQTDLHSLFAKANQAVGGHQALSQPVLALQFTEPLFPLMRSASLLLLCCPKQLVLRLSYPTARTPELLA